MSSRISVKTIQKCQLSDNDFSKEWFVKLLIDNITQQEFNMMCKEIMHLNIRYDSTVGLNVTDRPDLIIDTKNVCWYLEEIDFNQPITFKKII